jgi:hypothetical protein
MATERLSMRQIREILRQKWCLGQSHRAVAESLGIGDGTVGTTVLRARAAGLDWAQVESLTDEVLEARVYGPPTPPTHHRVVPDCAYLHAERRKPGVTLELLHLEYLEQHPDGYRYTQFCEFYRRWCKRRGFSMRQVHQGGEKCFVDYAGTKPSRMERAIGSWRSARLPRCGRWPSRGCSAACAAMKSSAYGSAVSAGSRGPMAPTASACSTCPPTRPAPRSPSRSIHSWARRSKRGKPSVPPTPPLRDPRTGELVALLFCLRAKRVARDYFNQTLIPALCRKAGVPQGDARGRITSGRLDNVSAGSSGFTNAVLRAIPRDLTSEPLDLPVVAALEVRVSVRRTCGGGGHASGTARLWYNGQPVDSGAQRDAGSRFGAIIGGAPTSRFLRSGFALSAAPGTSRQAIDVSVDSKQSCTNRTFKAFGTWGDNR